MKVKHIYSDEEYSHTVFSYTEEEISLFYRFRVDLKKFATIRIEEEDGLNRLHKEVDWLCEFLDELKSFLESDDKEVSLKEFLSNSREMYETTFVEWSLTKHMDNYDGTLKNQVMWNRSSDLKDRVLELICESAVDEVTRTVFNNRLRPPTSSFFNVIFLKYKDSLFELLSFFEDISSCSDDGEVIEKLRFYKKSKFKDAEWISNSILSDLEDSNEPMS